MARRLTPEKSLKVKNKPPKQRGPSHGALKRQTQATAGKRASEMDRALKAIERGAPGTPARPAPKQPKRGK